MISYFKTFLNSCSQHYDDFKIQIFVALDIGHLVHNTFLKVLSFASHFIKLIKLQFICRN